MSTTSPGLLIQIESIKLLLQAAGVAIGLVAAGAALPAFLLRGL